MYRILLAAAAVFTSTFAFAADMPARTYKAPVVAPVALYNWTGFYVGGHVGYGWAYPEIALVPTGIAVLNPPRPRGGLGGLQGGYNWQSGSWVFGIEADFTWSGVQGTSTCIVPGGTLTCTGTPDEYATITGRVGYAFDRALFYVKGGGAWMSEGFRQLAITVPICVGTPCTGSNSTWGWTAGAGVEYALDRNWSIRGEYDFLDFDRAERVVTTNGVSTNVFDVTRTFHLLKFGVNYRFGGPVVAKY